MKKYVNDENYDGVAIERSHVYYFSDTSVCIEHVVNQVPAPDTKYYRAYHMLTLLRHLNGSGSIHGCVVPS